MAPSYGKEGKLWSGSPAIGGTLFSSIFRHPPPCQTWEMDLESNFIWYECLDLPNKPWGWIANNELNGQPIQLGIIIIPGWDSWKTCRNRPGFVWKWANYPINQLIFHWLTIMSHSMAIFFLGKSHFHLDPSWNISWNPHLAQVWEAKHLQHFVGRLPRGLRAPLATVGANMAWVARFCVGEKDATEAGSLGVFLWENEWNYRTSCVFYGKIHLELEKSAMFGNASGVVVKLKTRTSFMTRWGLGTSNSNNQWPTVTINDFKSQSNKEICNVVVFNDSKQRKVCGAIDCDTWQSAPSVQTFHDSVNSQVKSNLNRPDFRGRVGDSTLWFLLYVVLPSGNWTQLWKITIFGRSITFFHRPFSIHSYI